MPIKMGDAIRMILEAKYGNALQTSSVLKQSSHKPAATQTSVNASKSSSRVSPPKPKQSHTKPRPREGCGRPTGAPRLPVAKADKDFDAKFRKSTCPSQPREYGKGNAKEKTFLHWKKIDLKNVEDYVR